MEELEVIVQRMIDANEPEDNIAKVIKEYNSKKENDSQIVDAPAESDVTASSSEDGFLESQDDTIYKTGLLPEVEIEAEREDDIVIRNPWGRGSFTISRKGWGSFFLGRPEEETEQAQAAEIADEYMDAIHSVKAEDEDVQDAIAESYFNFSAMEKRFKTERVYSPSQKGYILQKVVSDDEQDYKDYFGDTKEGKIKFETWKEYNKTGKLNLENIPSKNIASGKNSIKSKKAELFNERLSDKEREDYQYFLYGDKATKDNKDEIDFEKEYGRPLVRTETIKGRTYVPSDKKRKLRFEEEAKKQNEYLSVTSKSIEKETKSFQEQEANYIKESSQYTDRYNSINNELQKLGVVTSDSNPELIEKYNGLIIEANNLKKAYKNSGLDQVYESLLSKAESLNSKSNDLYDKVELFNDTQIAKKAATLNYSNTERAALQIEKAFLGGGAMLGSSVMLGLADLADYVVDGYNKAKAVEVGTDREDLPSVNDTKLYEYLRQGKNASVDYYRMLGGKLEDDFSKNLDFDWRNIDVWLPQAFANNSPSILAIAGTMGTASLITRVASPLFSASKLAGDATRFAAKANRAALMKNAKKLAQASFFIYAGGSKAGDLEIAQQDAPLIIEGLKKSYDLAKTNDEKLLIAKQIAEQEDALSITELQKAFSYTVHGGVELLTEKLGSLNAITNFRRFSKAVGGGLFKRSGRLAADIGVAQTIEFAEELSAQFLQNAGEIVIESKDKSLADGIDKNFFANTIVTGLAIQGGNIGSNLYNIIKSEVQTAKEINRSNELMEELIEIQDILQKGVGLSSKDRQLILKRKKEIIKEAALADVTTVQKLNRLSEEEIELAFELARKRRAKLKEISELGYTGDVSKFMQKQKEKLFEEFRQIENQRSELLSKNEKAKLDKAKDLANPAKAVYASGLNDLYSDLAKYSLSQSKGEYVEIKGQVVDGEFIPKNPLELLEQLTEKYGAETASELVSEYLNGANAGFVGSDIIVFQDNIDSKIYNDKVDDIETLIAAVSPMHEVLHGKNKEAGLIKDGKLVESARIATEGIEALLKEKLEQGRISQEAFDSYIGRRDELYTDKDGVNAEEMINLVNDLVAIGALSQGDFRSLFGFKSFINSLAKRFLGDESLFYPLETAEDIFGYVKSFQKEFKGSNLLLTGTEEDSEAKLSKARKTVLEEINNLIPENVQTNDQYNDFLDNERNFMALYNAMQENGVISNYVKSRTISSAEYAEAIDSIVMRLRNFKPDAIREKGPKKGERVGREGFGEFIFANTNFGKLDAKKALAIKAEETKQTKSLDADESFTQVADESIAFDEDATPTRQKAKKTKINVLRIGKVAAKEKQLVDNVEVKQGDTFKEVLTNNTGKVGEVIFDVPGTKLTDATKNLTYSKKFVDGIPEPSEADNIQSFFSNAEAVRNFIKILPKTNVSEQAADINLLGENIDVSRDVLGLGLGTSNNVLKYFYNKTTKRSKGKKSQPFIWELKDEFVNPSKEQIEQFQEALGITPKGQLNKYDRNIGQLLKGAAKMMAGQASLSAAQRKLEVKLETAKPEEIKAIKQQTADITAAQNKVAFSRGKKAAEKHGYERLDLNKEQAKEDFIDWIKETGSKIMPRSFWEATGNLIGSGAKYRSLIIDGKEVKEYFLKGGGTILETDPDYSDNQLNLMPEGKMVFANKNQMNEAFKDVEFIAEDIKIKDSVKRITLYGKKTGNQVKQLIDKKKDFLDNSDKGFIETWLTIAQDIKNNPNNRRFWAGWLEVTPQNMSHFMRVGARLSFYNTLNLTNVEEHTSPATDFAFELWDLANEGKLNESSIKKAMESYIQGSLPKIFDNLLKGEDFNYIDSIPKEYRSQVFKGEMPVWIRYINEKVNAQKYMLDGVEYSGVNPNVIILADGKTLAEQFGLGVPSKQHFNQDVISIQQELLLDVFTNKISVSEASNKLKVALAGVAITKELKQDRETNKSISENISNVRATLQYTKSSRGMSTFDFDDTLAFTKSGVRLTRPNDTGKPQPGRKAILLVGAAGAGKTTVINQLGLRKQGFKYVNQDVALDWLSKNSGLPQNMNDFTREQSEKWRDLQYEAAYAAKDKASKLRGKGDGVIIDSTGGNIREISRDFKDAGYDVQVIFVNSSLETALARNKARTERRLTDTTVRNSYEKVQKSIKGIKELVNFFPYSVKEFVEVNTDNIKQGEALPTDFVQRINKFTTSYIKERINAEEFATKGSSLLEQGAEFDFSEFSKVVDGTPGPLLQKMKNQVKKYGSENVYVLTARPADSAGPIHQFLQSEGINIPLENITGLGNSTGEAKAAWMLQKYQEGYNDMYFVDDALQNVKAVQHVFDQLDVKGKSVQAKVKFSKALSKEFNQMLQRTKGVGAEKVFSRVAAQKRGKNIGKYKFFVPPSADDFAGLLYYFYGKGKQGNADMEFMKKALLDPFARADREMSMARMTILDDYKELRKQFPEVKKKLGKLINKESGFTFDNAIRVYLFNKAGYDIPGLSKRDVEFLDNVVKTDQDLKTFADLLGLVSKRKEGYIEPTDNWSVENIASDMQNIVDKIGRKQFLAEFIENKNIIFSPENMNKIEAVYGSQFRLALEDILFRMENGTNRSTGKSYGQAWTNWVNGSVGAIMFFNSRSAVLQTLSTVNFINFQDNNIFAAGKALANQKQYWSDFSTLFNSDFLRARRAGLKINVNEAELASAVAGAQNKAKAALRYLLKIGFTPTQIADSFAIASGGSTFYRNRINTYLKQGMAQKTAEEKAFLDFQEIAQETQQSSRPDRISQQQASPLGRLILAFANTPLQYNRLIKKAALDLANKRGDWRSNVSRILYYGAIQNVIFSAMQSAIFALSFDDEEDDEIDRRTLRIANGMTDTILRGSGITGAAVATIKNVLMEFAEQSKKESRADYGQVVVEALQVSPPMGSKARKLYSALNTYKFDREIMASMDTFDYNNPIWDAIGNVTSAATNLPLDRGFRKIDNIREALNQDNSAMQRAFLFLGWSSFDLQVGERVVMNQCKKNEYVKYLDTKRQAQQEAEDKLKKEKKQAKQSKQCTARSRNTGRRCQNTTTNKSGRCYVHN